MDEYISRNEAIEIISNAHFPEEDWDTENNASYALKLVRDYIPAADVTPVVHGRWIKQWCDNNMIGHEYEECSICGCSMLDTNQFWDSKFCPNCGARMENN